MDCLDAWLIASIDQSIENTKPSSKADMKNMSEGRSLSSQSSVVLSPDWRDLINLVGRADCSPSYTIKTSLIETK